MADYVKLANPQGSFFDFETKFGVSCDDVEELTEPIGKLTRQALKFGQLVRCDPPEGATADNADVSDKVEDAVGADPGVCPPEGDTAKPDTDAAAVTDTVGAGLKPARPRRPKKVKTS